MQGWRTLGLNVLMAIGAALVAYNWSDILPPAYAWLGIVIVNGINMGMRYITTTPVGVSVAK